MSETEVDPEFAIPFPLELVIGDTPVSAQSANSKSREPWKQTVGRCAQDKINSARELYHLDKRPLMVTIFYFPDFGAP